MKESRKAIDRNADYCKKELGTIKRNQVKLENSFTERKVELKAINSKLNNAEAWISDLEDRIMKITKLEKKTERPKKKKNESNIQDQWNNIKHDNLCIVGIPEEEERE